MIGESEALAGQTRIRELTQCLRLAGLAEPWFPVSVAQMRGCGREREAGQDPLRKSGTAHNGMVTKE